MKVASVATDANGNTVATLTQNVLGTDDYFNVAPAGTVSNKYLNAVAIDTAADNLTVQNFAIKFTDMSADTAMSIFYTRNLNINNVTVLNRPNLGGKGAIGIVGSIGTVINNVTSPAQLGLNSCRSAVVTNSTFAGIALEEAATDNSFLHNTLTDATEWDIRINDMACERNSFTYNTIHGGVFGTGAIAIAEGIDTTIAFNTIKGGDTTIWAGTNRGTVVHDNIAGKFVNFDTLFAATVYNNSWQ